MNIAIRDEICHARKSWPGTLVDPCLLSGKNRPEIEFCPMHTYKHASGVYNACETAKLRLFPDKNHTFSLHIVYRRESERNISYIVLVSNLHSGFSRPEHRLWYTQGEL